MKQASRTTAVTTGSAPRIYATQETAHQADRVSSRSEVVGGFSKDDGFSYCDSCSVNFRVRYS